jgi:signal transduction histidine kinase
MQLSDLLKRTRAEGETETPSRLRAWFAALWNRLSSLRAKLIVPYVLLTLLIALVGVYVITRLVTSTFQERFVNQLFEAARVTSDSVVRRERTQLENLRLIAFTQGVPEALQAGDVDQLEALILPLALNNELEAVTIVDPNGVELLTLVEDLGTGQYVSTQGADYSEYDFVQAVLEGRVDEFGDKYADVMPTTFGPFLFTSSPVRNSSGQITGGALVGTSLRRLLAETKSQALADVSFLSPDGSFVATTLVIPDEGVEVLEVSPAFFAGGNDAVTFDLELYGRGFQAVVAPLILRGERMGILSVVLPSDYVVTPMAISRDLFSLIFSIGTLAIIILGYLLAQGIARPILRLRSMSQAVASGDLEQKTGLARSDEIGELAQAFDAMTARLRERTEEARRLYEETVERNQELAEAYERLKNAQAQLVQSEKLASVGQLTAGIVHDVKNPLAVIKGISEELYADFNQDPEAQNLLTTIRESAARASTIVTDLLKFARQNEPILQTRDMRETLEACIRLTEYLTRKGNVEVEIDLPDEAVMLTYDPTQIEQVMINLITNGVQAMPDGGSMHIALKQVEGEVAIRVTDSGCGIPEDERSRIFDPFFTTKPEGEGTGLGLSVSYGIIARHGGRIEVESEVGAGSTFTVYLPKALEALKEEEWE